MIAVVGAGPAGLMAAEVAALSGFRVTVYDHMPRPGRKLLLAGRGGLNLTHSEPLEAFLGRYREGAERLQPVIAAFPPKALRDWADGLGAETFVGSSQRVFPKAMKASPLLRRWLQRLGALGVRFEGRMHWTGFAEAGVRFVKDDVETVIAADALILAVGGASWPELGSDGGWRTPLRALGATITPFEASNAAMLVDWPPLVATLSGAPFKMIDLAVGAERFRGEAILTAQGMEGGVVYAASSAIRRALQHGGPARVHLDLQPNRDAASIAARLSARDPKRSLGPWLQKTLGLSPPAARLITSRLSQCGPEPIGPLIKTFPIKVHAMAPLDRAISTAGGLCWEELDDDLMLKRRPGVFAAGEMLDWDAPTGGYLMQACFATGRAAGLAAAAFAAAKASDASTIGGVRPNAQTLQA